MKISIGKENRILMTFGLELTRQNSQSYYFVDHGIMLYGEIHCIVTRDQAVGQKDEMAFGRRVVRVACRCTGSLG